MHSRRPAAPAIAATGDIGDNRTMTEPPDTDDETRPEQSAPDPHRSGLKDPRRATAALGAIILGLESLVLLLTIVPLRMLQVDHLGATIGLMLLLTLSCIVLAGMMRRPWAWYGGSAIQLVLLVCGLIHWAIAGVGLIFGLTWLYALSVRRKLSKPPVRE
jgi:hypothetical protein